MNQRRGSRDIALATLIDLLVQVVFVFTLLLIASGAIEGLPEDRGYTPLPFDEWKKLVSIFDVEPRQPPHNQAKAIESRYHELRLGLDELTENNKKQKRKIDELDAEVEKLLKQRGAPGYPPCRRANDGAELLVISATIDNKGYINASPLADAKEAGLELRLDAVGRNFARQQFAATFEHWRLRGMSAQPPCKYVALVKYDPSAIAGDYQPSVATIGHLFRLKQITKTER